MQPDDMSGGTPEPQLVERRLAVFRWEAGHESLEKLYGQEGGARMFYLEDNETLGAFGSDWRVASHTFQMLEDGGAVLSILFERLPS